MSARRSLALAPHSDERLARLVARDGQAPFAELYERYHQALYRYCRSIVRDEQDAQDALQSTMAGAFAALRKGERDLAVRPWLFRIAHNESISLLRRRPRELAADELALTAPADTSEPPSVVEQRERLAALLGDLRGLTDRQRSVLVMREVSGLSIAEIAAACSSASGAVKQTLFEAREALRESERGRSMECEQVRRTIYEEDRRVLRGRRVASHLRACAGCRELAQGIATRRQDLRLLAPPLPAAAATALLSRLFDTSAGISAGAASAASSGTAGGAQAATSGWAGSGAAGTATSGAAGGSAAPSLAAHAGGTIAAKMLTTAVVLAAGAAGVAGVTLSASHHGRAAATAGSRRGVAAPHPASRASAGSGRLAHGSAPSPRAGRDAARRAPISVHTRRAAVPHTNAGGGGGAQGWVGARRTSGDTQRLHADGRANETHRSPGSKAPGQAKAHRNRGEGKSSGHQPRSSRAAAPGNAEGKDRYAKHRSSAPHSSEHAAHKPPPRGRAKPPKQANSGYGSDRGHSAKQPAGASGARGRPLESEAGSAEPPPSGHGKGAR